MGLAAFNRMRRMKAEKEVEEKHNAEVKDKSDKEAQTTAMVDGESEEEPDKPKRGRPKKE